MSKTFADLCRQDRRLVILRLLAQDADYSHNEYVLQGALKTMGHSVSQDKLRSELNWLAEQELLATDDSPGIIIAKLTRRGLDVAEGAATVPGVKRPEPGT